MRVVLAGGSGFLGRALASGLAAKGHDAVVLTRRPDARAGAARAVRWDPDGSASGEWVREIDGADAIVNLAGASIADRRWSAARKALLRESRLLSSRSLVAAIRSAARRPAAFIQGSALGYYGVAEDQILDESHHPGSDFLAQLAVAWEAEAQGAGALGCRLVVVRTGIVLARDGGALKRMLPPFQFFVGGPIGSGRQYFSWIHRDDWVALVIWAIERPDISGVINATAPVPVTNEAFASALGRALHRPSWLRVPGFALRLLVGEMADVALINGARVVPKRALDLGFEFRFPGIQEALAHL